MLGKEKLAVAVLVSSMCLLAAPGVRWASAASMEAVGPAAAASAPGEHVAEGDAAKSPYRIGPGDILEVVVWKNTDVSRKVWVRPDGRITLPLIGELVVEGLTTEEMTRLVTDRLKEYFADPVVTVSLEEISKTRPPRARGEPSAEAAGRASEKPPYRLGIGDALEVVVWKNPDVSRKVAIRPDGRITLPLVGEIYVEGMSTEQMTVVVTEKLRAYFTDPVVTVSLEEINKSRLLRIGPKAPEPEGVERDPYLIVTEDVLEVNVWKNPDLSRQVWVRPDGRVTLPLAGEVYVLGKTLEYMTGLLEARLGQYLTDPMVSVSLVDTNSYTVYLLGMVRTPGALKLRGPKTLLQVLAMAGGFQEFADTSNVIIVRWENGRRKQLSVNVKNILAKGAEGDSFMGPGDVIVVP